MQISVVPLSPPCLKFGAGSAGCVLGSAKGQGALQLRFELTALFVRIVLDQIASTVESLSEIGRHFLNSPTKFWNSAYLKNSHQQHEYQSELQPATDSPQKSFWEIIAYFADELEVIEREQFRVLGVVEQGEQQFCIGVDVRANEIRLLSADHEVTLRQEDGQHQLLPVFDVVFSKLVNQSLDPTKPSRLKLSCFVQMEPDNSFSDSDIESETEVGQNDSEHDALSSFDCSTTDGRF